jgi:hypothetical protein
MATLELAMIFPFLMLLVAVLFFVARAVAARTSTITQVRHDAFARRDQANPGTVLGPNDNALASLVTATAKRPVAGGVVFSGTTFQAQGLSGTTGRTWGTYGSGQQEVSFQPSAPFFVPSPTPLSLLSASVPVPDLSPFTAMNFMSTPGLTGFLGLAGQLQSLIGNKLGALSSLTAPINSLPVCQIALQLAQVAVATGALFNPQTTAQLCQQIQMLLQFITTAQPCLANLVAVNGGAIPTWDPNLGSQLQAIQINFSILSLLNQVAAFAR